jgi:GNAT superfamily N-acetyltransferase
VKSLPRFKLVAATAEDAMAIASLRARVARGLTERFGKGHWSAGGTERGVLFDMRSSMLCVARSRNRLIATLRLSTKKPWAIDKSYFSASKRALYLTSMAVEPDMQRKGIGRLCVEEAMTIAREWPADAIRLDAYDAEAGAGEFYRKCGFREVGRASYRGVPLIYFELLV